MLDFSLCVYRIQRSISKGHKQATLDAAGNEFFVSAALGVIVIGEGNPAVGFPEILCHGINSDRDLPTE